MTSYRYKAFLSYSHADEAWAAWLHKALESYRVPKPLVGGKALHGTVPARVAPVFRDREDLSSAASLSGRIKATLAEAESLVVICSPAAAQSKWVNEEIRYFRSLGRNDRIFCVIVDGDPQLTDRRQACFPPALLEGENGGVEEPLAADARKWADGRLLAKLKLLAGILGVRLDELRQRERQRRRRNKFIAGLAALAVAALVALALQSYMAWRAERAANMARQAAAEAMLDGFLEQAKRLNDVADLETRRVTSELLADYLSELDPADLTPESRRQYGAALSNRGMIIRAEGHLDQAMQAFEQARLSLQLLVDDVPEDADAMFELGQATYWVGQVSLDLGRIDDARRYFEAYSDISQTLHQWQPDNAEWTMEAAYAQSNLGLLELRRVAYDSGLLLEYFLSALELNVKAAKLDPVFENELAESHANVADAWLHVCNLQEALASRHRNVELAEKYYRANPVSNRLKQDYAFALAGLSWVQQQLGQVEAALDSLQVSLDMQVELYMQDPQNFHKRFILAIGRARMALLLRITGHPQQSRELSRSVEAEMRLLVEEEPSQLIDFVIEFGTFLANFANLAYALGDSSTGARLLAESIDRLSWISQANPGHKLLIKYLSLAYFYYWGHNGGALPEQASLLWLEGAKAVLKNEACSDVSLLARLAVMEGEPEEARAHVSWLLQRGYHEPEFMSFCNEHKLCSSPER